ncbi:hypothetical protein [Pseudomonas knackmussii]|uniref:hypothetical protein n=1 Tax=Pseudomonas knackmussii TaxID=65741 RepID=UPI001363A2CD|nr:hypothetical protein [Pseudomonas knackmussii]
MNQALSLPLRESTLPVELFGAAPEERPDGWTCRPADATREALFVIRAEAEADVLCKLLNLFALQGWLPSEVHAVKEQDWLRIELRVPGLPAKRAEVLAERMRSMVSVAEVQVGAGIV